MKKLPLILSLTALLFGFAIDADAETILTLESPRPSVSSSEARRNAFSMELLGRGGLYSFNYDFLLTDDIALGGGVASYSLSSGSANASAWVLPLYANYYFTQGQHRVFASGGANLILVSGNVAGDTQIKGSGLAGVLGAGYEFRGEDGFLFRATPYVFVGKATGGWIGFTVGYSI